MAFGWRPLPLSGPAAVVPDEPGFVGKFTPPKVRRLALLSQNIAADQSTAQVQPSTPPHFIGKFQPHSLAKLKSLWLSSAADVPVVVVNETNTHFVGRFTPARLSRLPQLSRVEAQDESTPQVQPETNVHFVGKFTPARFTLLTPLRHNIAADFTSTVAPATNVHFIGKFRPTRLNRLLGLSHNIAADYSTPQTQPETNTHFIGKFRPSQIKLLPGLTQNVALTGPVFVVPETNVHFIGKFRQTRFTLSHWLRHHPAHDLSEFHFCPDVIGSMAAYSVLGTAAGYTVVGTMAVDTVADVTVPYSVIGTAVGYSIVGTSVGPNAGAISADGIDSFTKLMLHMNGADGSTVFYDDSESHRTVVVTGNAQIDTAQSKFGGASGLFDGTGDGISLDGGSDFAFGTGDFTIDLWLRLAVTGVTHPIYYGGNSVGPLFFYVKGSTNFLEHGTDGFVHNSGTTALVAGVWYHVMLSRSGSSTKMFLNGVQDGPTYGVLQNYTNTVNFPRIGMNGAGTTSANASYDEYRVSKGIARQTANFTPPTREYSPIEILGPTIGSMAAYQITGSTTLQHECN